MEEKVVLLIVDGLRSDAFASLGLNYVEKLREASSYCERARSVLPSMTLPALTSAFYGVEPDRHRILTNEWSPQIRPITGLIEWLDDFDKTCAVVCASEEVREICRPNHLLENICYNGYRLPNADGKAVETATACLENENPDFLILHVKGVDIAGHRYGFESVEYAKAVEETFTLLEPFIGKVISDGRSLILISDHGGTGRNHTGTAESNLSVPMLFYGENFQATRLENASIIDVAKTVASVLNAPFNRDWEGNAIGRKAKK